MKNKLLIIWPLIIISYLGMFSFGLYDNSRGPIYPTILEDFHILPSVGSWIFTLSSLAGVTTTLAGNRWLKLFGTYRSMQVSIFMQILACLCFGLSTQFGYHFYFILLSSLCFGVSSGILGICANIMISKSVDQSIRRRTFSGLHSMYGLASFLAPVLINLCYSWSINWNEYFYLTILIPLLTFLLSSSIKPKMDLEVPHQNNQAIKTSLSTAFFPCFIFSIYVASEIIVSSQLVYYVETTYNYDNIKSNHYLSLFFLMLLLGRLTFSVIKLPLQSFQWLLVSLGSSLFLFIIGLTIHPIFLSLLGLTQSFFYPCAMDWLYEKYHELSDSIIPYIMTSISLALIIMHFVVGLLASIYGITNAMYLGPLFIVLALIGIMLKQRFLLKKQLPS